MALDEFYDLPESEQGLWIAKRERDRRKCSCGSDPHICGDAERTWYPQRQVCFVTMEVDAAQRTYAELHKDRPFHDGSFAEWSAERSAQFPYHANDGVTISVAPVDLSPDDEFLTRKNAPPGPANADA